MKKLKRRQGDPVNPIDKLEHAVELLEATIIHFKALTDANIAMRKTIKAGLYTKGEGNDGPQEETD